jgi:tRNA A37 methylthiotransferase MiaB
MKKAQIIVTSCNRRSLELEQVKNFLGGNGYSIISEDFEVSKDADLILHSTCAFTTAAEDLGIETLNRIQKEKKPSAKVIVCGCLPEINPGRLSKVFDGDTFGPRSYERLDDIIEPKKKFQEFPRPNTLQINKSLKTTVAKAKALISSYDGSLQGLDYMMTRIRKYRVRNAISKVTGYGQDKQFYVQIQEGCPCKCSYCVIRFAIKELKSKPIDDVVDEFQKGLEQGYKKFYFMGDSAGAYGLDIGKNLGNLLKRVLEIDWDFSLHLTDISPVFLHLCFNEIKVLCAKNKISSLYVPIQSGNPRILELMRRNCNVARVRDMLLELKSINSVKIGTSIIVGFPSETKEELYDTIEFCEQVGFDWVYCHSFSARPETVAAELPGQLSPEEILERSRLVRSRLHDKTRITTAEDTKGNRTCQG